MNITIDTAKKNKKKRHVYVVLKLTHEVHFFLKINTHPVYMNFIFSIFKIFLLQLYTHSHINFRINTAKQENTLHISM